MKKIKRSIALLLAALMLISLAACGASGTENEGGSARNEDSSGEKEGGFAENEGGSGETANKEITVGTLNTDQNFEPAFGNNGIGFYLVYETLFDFNSDTGELENLLCEEYEWVDDTTLKIKLRENATFSNGDPVTTEDVKWSLQYYIEVGSNLSTYFANYDFDNFELTDDKNMVIKYNQPLGPALNYFSLCRIQDKSYYEEKGEDAFWAEPVGSGPYTVSENVSGSSTTYQLRDDYWGEKPDAEKITVNYYSEASTMYMDFENGDIDVAVDLDNTDAERAQKDTSGNVNLVIQSDPDTVCFVMPSYKAEFTDIRVREAIAIGVDWENVAKSAYGILYVPATSTLPEGVQYKVDVGSYEYNPEKAKQLLEDAGYGNGFTIKLIMMNDVAQTRLAEAIMGYLSELNITLDIHAEELTVAVGAMMSGESEAMIKAVPGGATCMDPDQEFDMFKMSSTNLAASIKDEELDGYIMGGLNTVDEEERADNYKKAQEWIYENMWAIPICETTGAYVYNNRLTLNVVSPTYPNLRYAHLK